MFDDITGKTFGRLTPIQCVQKTNNKITTKWECHCSCDDDKGKDYVSCIKTARAILIDHTQSCGCLGREKTSFLLKHDLTGQRFGRLVVLEDTHKRKFGSVVWKCLCDCGNTVEIMATNLVDGTTQSCGCLHSEMARQQMSIDISNQRFGHLVAIEPTVIDNVLHWRCKCDCGNELVYVKAGDLRSGNTQSCGCIKSRGEARIQSILESLNIFFKKEYTFKDLKGIDGKRCLRFDFYLPDYNCCIEYDGEQHYFSKHCGWNNDENLKIVQDRDKRKNQYCKNRGITLVRIPYWDYDKIDANYLIKKFIETKGE